MHEQNGKYHRRIAVIGLDGLSPSYLDTVVEKGFMPYYKHLYYKSLTRNLDCIPPLTPPSWASIMSGVNPGKHGIFDFIKLIYSNGSWKGGFYTSLDLKHPRIHEMSYLSKSRLYSLILNPIPDTPIIPVKNSVIASLSFFTPRVAFYPDSMVEYLDEDVIEAFNKYLGAKGRVTKDCSVIDESVDILEHYINILETFTSIYDFNLIWINLNFPDHIFHSCYKALLKPDLLYKIFINIDKIVKKIHEYSGEILIVSDHGFKYYPYQVNINEILKREGYLIESGSEFNIGDPLEETDSEGRRRLNPSSVVRIPISLYKLFKQMPVFNSLGRSLLKFTSKITGRKVRISVGSGIDYTRSKAFLPVTKNQDTSRFYVYIADLRLLEKVYNALLRYNIQVYKTSSVFNGPYVNDAPHLIVLGDDKHTIAAHGPNGMIRYRANRGNHDRFGVLAAYLSDIDSNLRRELADILPNTVIAPMIMCRLGIPLSSETDHVSLVRKLCGGNSIRTLNYKGRWMAHLSIANKLLRSS